MKFKLRNILESKPLLLKIFLMLVIGQFSYAQEVGILKYDGGGDWYANPTAVPNLIRFCNENIRTNIDEKPDNIEPQSKELFSYPIVFLTGHGNVYFSDDAINNIRNYLISGGFLHISDNYGLDTYIRREMKKVFPEIEFVEIPFDHAIYHQSYDFDGLPKIHEHDKKPASGYGLFYEGRLICFYDYESDLSDGWEDEFVHNDPPEVRLKALQMGANIISYAFKN
ncbi:DUF4159 domain-containing protein [Lutimonas zeaxanthinifaciens]|uniref:DUF4159 domain-containing protein n=1 Tax=Lutimonas zeaxanthinifaciens TaxID=3060215 RepID=UPI00265CD8FE|nr:DUF4159 domain-containing protein [Lutimonas sp. YSD2104]WKK65207.1 DUF4159 domain-containing protein [Lutimonas sp. YSD2104]